MNEMQTLAWQTATSMQEKYFSDHKPFDPVPLIRIQRALNIEMGETPFDDDEIEAKISKTGDETTVIINETIDAYDQPLIEAESLGECVFATRICGYDDFKRVCRFEPHPNKPSQVFAHEFAIVLMLPKEDMLKATKTHERVHDIAAGYWIDDECVRERAEQMHILNMLAE